MHINSTESEQEWTLPRVIITNGMKFLKMLRDLDFKMLYFYPIQSLAVVS